jgi:histidine ammonia-lyase
MSIHHINHQLLSIEKVHEIISTHAQLALSDEVIQSIGKSRQFLNQKMKTAQAPVYGINTGFGSLCNTVISDNDLGKLQENLVKSHACGMGDKVPTDIIKLMLLLKIQGLSYGYSGVQLATVQRLVDFYNNDVLPVIYTQGSLGASGDLAPLAHLSLPLLGLGEVYYKGEIKAAAEVNKIFNWQPIQLQSKEGLALLNGTQFMSAYGVWCVLKAKHLSQWADLCAAISLDGFDGRYEPFNQLLHHIRPHEGQIKTAENILKFTNGSEIGKQTKVQVQDPYSFRCVPQVHGASKDVITYAEKIFTTEINAVTDNPTVFANDDVILSGGNFHGQPLAIALDMLCIALAELGNISERRTYQLISGSRNLPAFLVANPGLNSGFMIPQYTAASIVSQNKQLCSPASVDSIVSSNGQEDHVSMGANAAVKCAQVANNLASILGIELMNGNQALDFRKPLKSSPFIEQIKLKYRDEIDFITDDILMYPQLQKSKDFILSQNISI